jgi:hypothetical protein
LSCPAKAGHSISINEPVDSRVKGAILYRFPHLEFGESGRSRRQSARAFNSTFKKTLIRRVLKPHRTTNGRRESACVFKMRRSCSSQETRAQYAAPRPLLQRLSPTLCTPILRFTDISVTGADQSNPWLCFVRRHFNQCKSNIGAIMSNEDGWQKDAFRRLRLAGGERGRAFVLRAPPSDTELSSGLRFFHEARDRDRTSKSRARQLAGGSFRFLHDAYSARFQT